MSKYALFVFNGEPMCFIHVLLNALDMDARGDEVQIVLEGASVKLVPELYREENPQYGLWRKCLDRGLVAGVCKACSSKLGTLEAAQKHNLPLLADMSGHPAIAGFREQGCEVITF
ncbi:MAG: cytoplasmic protein [Thermodesulfobacteriota bacterium]